jgi:oxidase EvaA
MQEKPNDIQWFLDLLKVSCEIEDRDTRLLLEWLEKKRQDPSFSAHLIGVSELESWYTEAETGNIKHQSGEFFSIEGVSITSAGLREVNDWDQPIFTQKEGGILALICRQEEGKILFLLNAKAEPGNINTLQFAPSLQATWSNLQRAHQGRSPAFADILLGEVPARLVYSALHNEEGGRFWMKTNSNQIYLVDPNEIQLTYDQDQYIWASLSQIKALALVDNVLNPFVKTIIAPL